jgi:hypothetical protein
MLNVELTDDVRQYAIKQVTIKNFVIDLLALMEQENNNTQASLENASFINY